jgi:plasmid maintenance system antidote protein VapI
MAPPHPGAFIREEILDELGLGCIRQSSRLSRS